MSSRNDSPPIFLIGKQRLRWPEMAFAVHSDVCELKLPPRKNNPHDLQAKNRRQSLTARGLNRLS